MHRVAQGWEMSERLGLLRVEPETGADDQGSLKTQSPRSFEQQWNSEFEPAMHCEILWT